MLFHSLSSLLCCIRVNVTMAALMKDVPDAVGDAQFNIRSFTVRIGQEKNL